jgi:hypothetical protein
MGVSCVYESYTNHRPQSREAQKLRPLSEIRPRFSWNQQRPDHATQSRRPLAAQVPRSHSIATDQSSEFRTPALDRGNFLFFPPSFFQTRFSLLFFKIFFWCFWLTIQNTANPKVRNLLYLLAVFISFSFLVLLVNDSEYSRSTGAKPILPPSCIYLVFRTFGTFG